MNYLLVISTENVCAFTGSHVIVQRLFSYSFALMAATYGTRKIKVIRSTLTCIFDFSRECTSRHAWYFINFAKGQSTGYFSASSRIFYPTLR
jgi:hypothetical protein